VYCIFLFRETLSQYKFTFTPEFDIESECLDETFEYKPKKRTRLLRSYALWFTAWNPAIQCDCGSSNAQRKFYKSIYETCFISFSV